MDQLPLVRDCGEALAVYLREDRGISASQRIFLRIWAPRIGLTGPAAVGHIVRLALAEILRHRSLTTTAIYAQVSLDALRAVARPWPVTGGER